MVRGIEGSMRQAVKPIPTEAASARRLVAARAPGFFLPTAGFLPLGSGKGSYRGYRGIPLNTVGIQISNQNR
jgi:hypothetical protein